MKRPKKTKKLVYKKYEVTEYHFICPHCKTDCVGVSKRTLMTPCLYCGKPVDFRPKEKRNFKKRGKEE
jgi:hypothetical protein